MDLVPTRTYICCATPGMVAHKPKTAAIVKCPICGSPAVHFWFKKSGYPIYRCGACYSAFVWPRPLPEQLTAVYESALYGRDAHTQSEAQYRPSGHDDAELIIARCKVLTSGRRFLDIGAGEGLLSRIAIDHGFEVEAIEPNERLRQSFLVLNGIIPHAGFFDAALTARIAGQYDVAALSQVLEHLSDPLAITELLKRVLTPSGVVFIGVPHFGSLVSKYQDATICTSRHLNISIFSQCMD